MNMNMNTDMNLDKDMDIEIDMDSGHKQLLRHDIVMATEKDEDTDIRMKKLHEFYN
jgi:hypothetical protein